MIFAGGVSSDDDLVILNDDLDVGGANIIRIEVRSTRGSVVSCQIGLIRQVGKHYNAANTVPHTQCHTHASLTSCLHAASNIYLMAQ